MAPSLKDEKMPSSSNGPALAKSHADFWTRSFTGSPPKELTKKKACFTKSQRVPPKSPQKFEKPESPKSSKHSKSFQLQQEKKSQKLREDGFLRHTFPAQDGGLPSEQSKRLARATQEGVQVSRSFVWVFLFKAVKVKSGLSKHFKKQKVENKDMKSIKK